MRLPQILLWAAASMDMTGAASNKPAAMANIARNLRGIACLLFRLQRRRRAVIAPLGGSWSVDINFPGPFSLLFLLAFVISSKIGVTGADNKFYSHHDLLTQVQTTQFAKLLIIR